MKKILGILCAFALLLPTTFGLVGCKLKSGDLSATQRAREIYAYSAVIGANYLSSLNKTASTSGDLSSPSTEVDKSVQAELSVGLKMFDELLEKGEISTEIDNHQDEKYLDYKFKMVVEMPVSKDTFIIYFNEFKQENEGEYSKDALTNPDEEIEFSTRLAGKVVYGEYVYDLSGEREFEKDKGETESEITLKIKENENNYIELSQGVETEATETETEYQYKVVKDGKEVYEFEVEFENEDGQLELELEVKEFNGTTGENSKNKYKIKPSSTTGVDFVVICKQTNNGQTTTKTINVTKTSTGYTFELTA